MLAHKLGDRFSSADEVLKALGSQTPVSPPVPTNSNLSQIQTNIVAPRANPISGSNTPKANPSPLPFALKAIASQIHTLVVAPKGNPKPSPVTPNANNPVVQKPRQFLSGPVIWGLKVAMGTGFILVSAIAGWAVMNSVIRSAQLGPTVQQPDTTPITFPQFLRTESGRETYESPPSFRH
jgi:hypothetical protein